MQRMPSRILLLLLCLFPAALTAQTIYHGECLFFRANLPSTIERLGNAYYLAGTSYASNWATDAGCLMRIEEGGQTAWAKFYGGGTGDDHFYAMCRTQDKQLAIVGGTESFAGAPGSLPNLYLLLVDSAGNLLRSRSLGTVQASEKGCSVKSTFDNGLVIAGTRDSAGVLQPFLLKTDANLNVQWFKVYSHPDFSGMEATAVVQTSDGGFAFTGYGTPATAPGVTWMAMQWTDAAGQPTQARYFSYAQAGFTNHGVRGHDLIENTAGNLVAVGAVGGRYIINAQDIYSPLLVELTPGGNLAGAFAFSLNSGDGSAASVRQTYDGGYILGGTMGNYFAMMLKTDPAITTQWSYHYDFNLNPQIRGRAVRLVPGGGFIFVGGFVSGTNIRLIQTDPNGQSGCGQAVPSLGGASGPVSLGMVTGNLLSHAIGDTFPANTLVVNSPNYCFNQCQSVATAEPLERATLLLHPNPARDRVQITSVGADRLAVFNVNGERIYHQRLDDRGTSSTPLDITSWPAGIYLVRAGDATQKLIKP